MFIDIHDWQFDVEGARFTARPSTRSVLRQLWVTLLCALLAGLMIWVLGIPPGSQAQAKQLRRADQFEEQARQERKRAQQLESGATFGEPGSLTRPMRDQALERAADLEQKAQTLRQQVSQSPPTLGAVGDAVYWTALALLTLVGVGLPVLAPLARVTLDYEGPPGRGTLAVRQWFLIGRTRHIETREVQMLLVHAQRLVRPRTAESVKMDDLGWGWNVQLARATDDPDQPGQKRVEPMLSLLVEVNPVLPPKEDEIPARAREVARYLEAVTRLERLPPIRTDVLSVESTLLERRRWRLRTQMPRP